MWDLPGPGLEPVSPALAGGFLTTAPLGKSYLSSWTPLHIDTIVSSSLTRSYSFVWGQINLLYLVFMDTHFSIIPVKGTCSVSMGLKIMYILRLLGAKFYRWQLDCDFVTFFFPNLLYANLLSAFSVAERTVLNLPPWLLFASVYSDVSFLLSVFSELFLGAYNFRIVILDNSNF